MENYITPEQGATLKGCSARYLRLLFTAGKLPGVRVSARSILLDRSAVQKLKIDNTKRGRRARKEKE